jgi:UDP-glucose 4-epimerase
MKFLVLGGSGFIGTSIIDGLLLEGHEVRAYSRSHKKYNGHPQVEWLLGDITQENDFDSLLDGVDGVVHCVNTTVPATDESQLEDHYQDNILPIIRLVTAMTRCKVTRLVFLSSGGAVYGNASEEYVAEGVRTHPVSAYGILKLQSEQLIKFFEQRHGLQPLIIRASNPYGPGQPADKAQGLIPKVIKSISDNQCLSIFGDGEAVRDYIYINDLAAACVTAILSKSNGVYNIGSGVGYTINEVIFTIETLLNKRAIVEKVRSRDFDVKHSVLNCKKAFSDFGWKAQTNFREGIIKTLDSIDHEKVTKS